jgi:hypothetical protein
MKSFRSLEFHHDESCPSYDISASLAMACEELNLTGLSELSGQPVVNTISNGSFPVLSKLQLEGSMYQPTKHDTLLSQLKGHPQLKSLSIDSGALIDPGRFGYSSTFFLTWPPRQLETTEEEARPELYIAEMMSSIGSFPLLESLEIRKYKLGLESVQALVTTNDLMSRLTGLHLHHALFMDTHAYSTLLERLSKCVNLKTLILSYMKLPADTSKEWLDGRQQSVMHIAEKCTRLWQFDVSFQTPDQFSLEEQCQIADEIDHFIRQNKAGRHLLQEDVPLPPSAIPHLLYHGQKVFDTGPRWLPARRKLPFNIRPASGIAVPRPPVYEPAEGVYYLLRNFTSVRTDIMGYAGSAQAPQHGSDTKLPAKRQRTSL